MSLAEKILSPGSVKKHDEEDIWSLASAHGHGHAQKWKNRIEQKRTCLAQRRAKFRAGRYSSVVLWWLSTNKALGLLS